MHPRFAWWVVWCIDRKNWQSRLGRLISINFGVVGGWVGAWVGVPAYATFAKFDVGILTGFRLAEESSILAFRKEKQAVLTIVSAIHRAACDFIQRRYATISFVCFWSCQTNKVGLGQIENKLTSPAWT